MSPHYERKDVKTFEESFFHMFNRNMNVPFYWCFNWWSKFIGHADGLEGGFCKSDYSQFFLLKVEVDWNILNSEEKKNIA